MTIAPDGRIASLTAHSIAAAGFQFRHHELMDALRGLDEPAVRAVLVCVLAERIHADTSSS